MSLPARFEFCTKYARATRYTLSLDSTGKYICTASSLEDAYDLPATYSVEFVKAAIDCGNWIVTKVLEEAVEREMKFPFTVQHFTDETHAGPFVVSQGPLEGYVTVRYVLDEEDYYENFCTVAKAAEWIKKGEWIVKSVGEKADMVVPQVGARYTVKINDNGTIQSYSLPEAPQPPESTTISTLKVDIQCDTTEAVVNAKALAGALEELCVSMESVIALSKDMKKVFG